MSLSVIKLLFSVMCFTCVVVASDIHISSPSQHHNNSSSSSPSSHARSLLHQMTGNHYQILPSFDRTLSPRQIKTKNGMLRGILISHPAVVVPSLVSASGKSGAHSSSNNITAVPSLSSSIRSPVISHPQSTTGSSELQAVEGFLGVPYASPPLGSLRFMPPVTPSHWRGVRMANSLGPSCPQKIPKVINNLSHGRMEYLKRIKPFMENQSEDCLYLNVYTPFDRDSSEKLAVMFFVNGESYDQGSGASLDGTVLSSLSRVIVVTLNYRLGLFGFLPTTIEGSRRGNYALMDIIAALHWVHDNIAEMGGDAGNITLVGHDRGAAIANLLMISPMARGLFCRLILMSGSALSPLTISTEADFYTQSLAKAVNCDTSLEPSHLLECLRTKSVGELNKVNLGIDESFTTTFGPIIDGLLIPTDPRSLMESENSSSHHLTYQHPIGLKSGSSSITRSPSHSLLFGAVKTEAPSIFTDQEERTGIDAARRNRILYDLVKSMIDYYQEMILISLVNEYTDWSSEAESGIQRLDSLLEILSDGMVVAPLIRTATLHRKHQLRRQNEVLQSMRGTSASSSSFAEAKTYSYVFSYQTEGSKYSKRLGCVHGEELGYLFGAPFASQYVTSFGSFAISNYTKAEIMLSRNMIKYFTNFAKYGNPNGIKSTSTTSSSSLLSSSSVKSDSLPLHWPEFENGDQKYLSIGSDDMKSSESSSPSLKVRDRYRSHRLSYWLNLIPRLQVHGKEESENFKRHLQDQRNFNGGKNLNEVAFFEKISLQFRDNLKPASSSSPSSSTGTLHHSPDSSSDQRTLSSIASVAAAAGASDPPSSSSARSKSLSSSDASTSNHNGGSGSGSNHSITSSSSSSSPPSSKSGKATTIILHPESDYSNLLTTTLGVGLTLLALNILAFSAVYYKFNKGKHQQQQQQQHPNGRHRRTGSSMSGTNPSAQGLGMAAPRRTSSVASKKGSLPRSSPHHHHHHQHHQQQQQQQIQQHTRSPAHLLSQQQQQLHSDAADHLLNHHHLESMVQQQQHDLLPGSYQISFTDSEYGSEAGFNDKHDLHSIYHQQQQQQQQHHVHPHSRHATVTFNDYISNQSSHAGTTATAQQQHQQQSLCVKYSASPSSLLMDEDGNVLTTAPLSDDCCHQLLSQPDIGHRMSPAAASIMDYGYTNGSQSNGIAVSSASSSVNPASCSSRVCTITGNQGPVVVPVNPCDVNCLTVIQELDDDEHM